MSGALDDLMEVIISVLARYKRTGKFGLNGTELQIARRAADVSDGLLELDRNGIAVAAALWARQQIDRIALESRCAAAPATGGVKHAAA